MFITEIIEAARRPSNALALPKTQIFAVIILRFARPYNEILDLGAPNHRVVAPCSLVGCTL